MYKFTQLSQASKMYTLVYASILSKSGQYWPTQFQSCNKLHFYSM